MTQKIRVSRHPVFPGGIFQDHPDLFRRFQQNSPAHLQAKYDRLWQEMPHYEDIINWHLVEGPGFQGATHPGADTVFVDIMVGINSYVYNSDCLYVNFAQRLFGISDPPGITTSSRLLFERLERLARKEGDIEKIVARLSEQTRPEDGATLSLVAFPHSRPGIAQVVIAGDTFVFRGNTVRQSLQLLSGTHDFIGTPYAKFAVQEIQTNSGDFFIIASDGILSLASADPERDLVKALRQHLDGNINDYALRVMRAANGYYREKIYDRFFGRFGGNDNISLLMVIPEQLESLPVSDSIILGGYLEERL